MIGFPEVARLLDELGCDVELTPGEICVHWTETPRDWCLRHGVELELLVNIVESARRPGDVSSTFMLAFELGLELGLELARSPSAS